MAVESLSLSPSMVIVEVREEINKIEFDLDSLGFCSASLVSECQRGLCRISRK